VIRALVAACAALAVLAGCYSGAPTDDPSTRPDQFYPDGVATPHPGEPPVPEPTGIWKSRQSDDPDCCWLGPRADFDVRVAPGARTLRLTMFIPDLPMFHENTQSMTVAVDGGKPEEVSDLVPGLHRVDAPLGAHHGTVVRVEIVPSFTFVPIKAHFNTDSRVLSIYLRAVRSR